MNAQQAIQELRDTLAASSSTDHEKNAWARARLVGLNRAILIPLLLEQYISLKRAREYAQEIQRGTDPIAQGDAHGCAQNIEKGAGDVLEAIEQAVMKWAKETTSGHVEGGVG